MHFSRLAGLAAWAVGLVAPVTALQFNDNPSDQEITGLANQMKTNLMTFYAPDRPGAIPGEMLRPDVYYWWQAGGLMGQLIHHWSITGNDSLNDLVKTGMLNQIGEQKNFEPRNQSKDEGNDDQVFWSYAAMDAAEYNFPAPDDKYNVSWLGLAQAVFNRQVGRWETKYCGGGVRWQIFDFNKGFNYKNVPANGGLFQLSARLARFTGNETYSHWAEKIWDWHEATGLLAPGKGPKDAIHVYDGFGIENNCQPVNTVQFTYNFGTMLMGASFMYNMTNGNQTWHTRIETLMNGLFDNIYLVNSLGANDGNEQPKFPGGKILTESADEFQTPQNSDNDDPAFKAYTVRWMAISAQLAPFIAQNISDILHASAKGAAGQCIGTAPAPGGPAPPGVSTAAPGSGNNWCGRRWYQTKWDGYSGMGEQMSAFSVFQNLLTPKAKPPLTSQTGGTSVSQPNAGGGNAPAPGPAILTKDITGGDKAGAAIMTILALALVGVALWFMCTGD